jgi:hypothetical protein
VRRLKLTGRAKAIVVIEVQHAAPLVSPAYDDGTTTEAEMLEATACGSPGSTNIAQAGNRLPSTERPAMRRPGNAPTRGAPVTATRGRIHLIPSAAYP